MSIGLRISSILLHERLNFTQARRVLRAVLTKFSRLTTTNNVHQPFISLDTIIHNIVCRDPHGRLHLDTMELSITDNKAFLVPPHLLCGRADFIETIKRIGLGSVKVICHCGVFRIEFVHITTLPSPTKEIKFGLLIWHNNTIVWTHQFKPVSKCWRQSIKKVVNKIKLFEHRINKQIIERLKSTDIQRRIVGINSASGRNVPLALIVPNENECSIDLFLNTRITPVNFIQITITFVSIAELVHTTTDDLPIPLIKNQTTALTDKRNSHIRID